MAKCKIFVFSSCFRYLFPMPNYIRCFENGHDLFITMVTHRRNPLLVENIDSLRHAFSLCKRRYAFDLKAVVILPDHLHMIIRPEMIATYPKIVSHIKRAFVYGLKQKGMDASDVWQRRYYEHTIRNEKDFKNHFDYIHFNPVKHGWARSAREWRHSSFEKFVREGVYEKEWCDFGGNVEIGE